MSVPFSLPERQPELPAHEANWGNVILPGGTGGGGPGRGGGGGTGRGGGEMEDQTPMPPSPPDELGTGIILEAPVPGGAVASTKRLLFEVTYAETLAEGRVVGASAVKWVTPRLASDVAVRESQCGNAGVPCAKTCVIPGCVCDPILHVCR